MNESACQPGDGVSCGACCGIFNLAFDRLFPGAGRAVGARRELLRERTRDFADVDFDTPATFVAYRQAREALEREIPRFDSEIYVCPFFGLLDEANHQTGCLVHPARTGRAHTQNFSFYGASICQAYDCRNKERDERQFYSRLLARYFAPASASAGENTRGAGAVSEEYARLMADGPLYHFFERFDGLFERLAAGRDRTQSPLRDFLEIARARLATAASAHVTSFEVPMRAFKDPQAELRELIGPRADLELLTQNLLAAPPGARSPT